MSETHTDETEQEYSTPQDDVITVHNTDGGNLCWSKEIGYIAWGLFLTSFSINQLCLQFILPTIGVLLLFPAVRNLRGKNKKFYAAYIITILIGVDNFACIALSATPYLKTMQYINAVIYLILKLVILQTLRRALNQVITSNGYKIVREPLAWATVWTIIMFLVAVFLHEIGTIIILILIIWDIGIYVSLNRMGTELDVIEKCVKKPPIKVSTIAISSVYILLLAAVVGVFCIRFNNIPQTAEKYSSTNISDNSANLIKMGFPSEVIKDITKEDISVLEKCVNVEAKYDDLKFNIAATEPNVKVTTVYIEMPDKELYILHYFKWLSGKPYWQDGIAISADSVDTELHLTDSALIYQKDESEYKAPFPKLNYGNVATSSTFFGKQQSNQFTGSISFPFASQQQRGYVLYHLTIKEGHGITCSIMNYMHMETPFNMPYVAAEEKILSDSSNSMRPQTYTTYESKTDS